MLNKNGLPAWVSMDHIYLQYDSVALLDLCSFHMDAYGYGCVEQLVFMYSLTVDTVTLDLASHVGFALAIAS